MERQRTPIIANTSRCLFPDEDSEASSVIDHIVCADSPLIEGSKSPDGSPTTVQAYPRQNFRKKTSIKSRIAMGDDGAEVLVDMSMLSISTPDKNQVLRRTHSLLDTQSSPTLSQGDSFAFHVVEDSPFGKCYHNANRSPFGLQKSIALCLGDAEDDFQPATIGCGGWQGWQYFSSHEEKIASPDHPPPKNRLTNRAVSVEARKMRVKHIRHELNPFNKSPQVPKEFAKSRSFSIISQVPAEKEKSSHATKVPTQTEGPRVRGLSDVFQLCTMPENTTTSSPLIIRQAPNFKYEEKEIDKFYDSDPEDFTRNRRRTPRKRKDNNGIYQRGIGGTPNEKFDDIYNDEFFCVVAQEFVHSTSTLIYHPTTDATKTVSYVVNAWIERGQDFGRSLIQPKWMWRSQSEESKSRQSMQHVHAVDLLNINRILKVDQIDRCRHPFVKPSSCFLVRTVCGDEFFFEAESQEARDKFVYSMKMVIARFGAMVLNQDEAIHEEYFATSEPIPGAIPAVLTQTELGRSQKQY